MRFEKLNPEDFEQLVALERRYKESIGEEALTECQINNLENAVKRNQIEFFVGNDNGTIVAMCSVCTFFSTYSCGVSGVFEDFFVLGDYRHKGVARELTAFVFDYYKMKGVKTLLVGCADIDTGMYRSLGFSGRLGNLLAWSADE